MTEQCNTLQPLGKQYNTQQPADWAMQYTTTYVLSTMHYCTIFRPYFSVTYFLYNISLIQFKETISILKNVQKSHFRVQLNLNLQQHSEMNGKLIFSFLIF